MGHELEHDETLDRARKAERNEVPGDGPVVTHIEKVRRSVSGTFGEDGFKADRVKRPTLGRHDLEDK